MKKLLRYLSTLLCVFAACLTSASALSVDEAIGILEDHYLYDIPAAAYQAKTVEELLAVLGDPYTDYMDPSAYESFLAELESDQSIVGIGAMVSCMPEGIRITSVLPGSGAAKAGLVQGDVITAIGGINCVPATESHLALLQGPDESTLTVTAQRESGVTRTFDIVLHPYSLLNTSPKLNGGICTIVCTSFGSKTGEYFRTTLTDNAASADTWVIDLRGNTGGYAVSAAEALGAFTGDVDALYYRPRQGLVTAYRGNGEDLTDKPVIVLVDPSSASMSELFAGGICAGKDGIVLGTRTRGKGTAQSLYDENSYPKLFDGDALRLTTGRYYCSNGVGTEKLGVLPTLLLDETDISDVAALLTAKHPERGEYLMLSLNNNEYYVDLTSVRFKQQGAALDALLSALPPDTFLVLGSENSVEAVTVDEAIARCGSGAVRRDFSDVADSPYATQINTLAAYRLLRGDNGVFSPSKALTRAELCVMLAHLLDVSDGRSVLFTDVDNSSWYASSVNAIAKLGLVDGLGDGSFDPDGTLTQEQFIAVMGRLVRFLNCNVDEHAPLLSRDYLAAEFASFAPWARESAAVLTTFYGNMLYTELDNIAPGASVTRGEAAATLCAMLKALDILSY